METIKLVVLELGDTARHERRAQDALLDEPLEPKPGEQEVWVRLQSSRVDGVVACR